MIQFAAALFDPAENRVVRAAKYLIRTVDDSAVPDGAAKVHGITTEILRRDGIPARMVYQPLAAMFERAQRVVAFNVKFDSLVLRAFCAKLGRPDLLAGKSIHCAMLEMKDVLKIPGKFGDYKWPSLAEAYAHVTCGEEIANAHDAMSDVRATVVVYSWLIWYYGIAQGQGTFRRPELTATFDTAINLTSVGPASPAELPADSNYCAATVPEPPVASPAALLAAPTASAELPAMYVRRPTDLFTGRAGPAPQNPELPTGSAAAIPLTKEEYELYNKLPAWFAKKVAAAKEAKKLGAYGSNQFELPL